MDVAGQRLLDRLRAVCRFGDDLKVRLRVENALEAGADDRMVIGDQNSCDERPGHHVPVGTVKVTSTPPPAGVTTASLPPANAARSRIP